MRRWWIRLVAALPLAGTTVSIDGGRARALRGTVPARLLSELGDLAGLVGVSDACLHVRRGLGGTPHLAQYGIPRALHQRFRNVWVANR